MDGLSTRDAAALVGRTFGEFVVRELISSGGFGMVFRAEQPALAREAVIKVLHTRHRASDTIAQRFLREAQLASKLDHPYAAHTYAFGAEPDGVLWIAMELVRGTPLDRLLEAQGPIALEQFVPLLDRICEVVHTAHEQGIVHRDLKPANVMVLRRAGRYLPKLLDFGIAKHGVAPAEPRADPQLAATMPEPSDASEPNARLTQHGSAMGSPHYMAPEQWLDAGTVDARTDQYALAVLCYEVLTGKLPFEGTSKIQIAMAHARQAPPRLGGALPAALDAVIARGLAKSSADRYASVLELGAAFHAASGVAGEPVTLPRLPDAVREQALARAPQPLAQAVATLDAARNAHQARDALWQVVRVAVRLVGVVALAAHAHVGSAGGGSSMQSGIGDALRGLRKRALSDADWLDVARELCRPFAAIKDAHPVPELIAFACGDARSLAVLFALRASSEEAGGGSDEQVRALLAKAMPVCAALLDDLAFLSLYPLVVPLGGGVAEVWMGARRADLPTIGVRGTALAAAQPALVDAGGVPVLVLWPYVQHLAPSPGAAECLFLLEGHGRRGARLVALPDAFERDDEALWDVLGGIVREGPELHRSSGEDKERCPFPGLAAFTTGDAATFFGRERETEAFVNRLRVSPLLAVVGPSGAGKSSFVQAGVIPALPDGWRAITVRPGAAPLASLAARLTAAGVETGDLRAELAEHPGALGSILRTRALSRRETIVLVVDQLEELFTLCDDPIERALYADALARAARSPDDPVRVVFTLRDDFLLHAEALPALRARLGQGLQLLTTPDAPDLRRIFVEPITAAGYELDDPALPDEIVAALAGAPGALALLSFTAAKLWDLRDRRFRQLSRKAYASLGGVGGALAQHAEATLEIMPADQRRLVREVFRHLVTADGTRAVLSRAELDQVLGGGPGADAAVEQLVAARLLVVSDADGGPDRDDRIEVIHEALLDAWPRLVTWRREDAIGARLRDQLRAATRQWDERGRATGLLWRGDALTEYRLWRARTPGALTSAEEAFAAASLADAARGRRIRTLLLAGAFVVLGAGLITLLILNARVLGERRRAQASVEETSAANAKLHDNLIRQYENQGRRLALDGDPMQALVYLAKAGELGAHGRAHDFLIAQAVRATDGERLELAHDGGVISARFSHDGRTLVTASVDHHARIWDARTGALVHALGHDNIVTSASFSPDDRLVVTSSFDATAAVWSAATGERMRTLTFGAVVRCAVFSPDGASLLATSEDDTIQLIDVATGKARFTAKGDGAGQTNACTFSADGARIASGDERGVTRVLDARTGAVQAVLRGHKDRVRAIGFSPDGARLLTAGRDGVAIVWDLASARPLRSLAHAAAIMAAEWSPDGTRVATASQDRTAIVWDAATGVKIATLAGHVAGVNRATFSPDGARVATASDDGTARLWDATTGRPLARWLGHRDEVYDASFGAGGVLATASIDGTAIVWSAVPHERITWLLGHTHNVDVARFSPDGAQVLSAGDDGTARIWDASDGRPLLVLAGHHGRIGSAAWSPDGRAVATAGDDATVRVWDARTGAMIHVLAGHAGRVNQIAWAPGGARLVSAGDDGTVRVWDAVTGQPSFTITPPGGAAINAATFDPTGALIATTDANNATRFWDAATGAPSPSRAPGDLDNVEFDPSGTRAASSVRQTLRVWDVKSGATQATMIGHIGQLSSRLGWSTDGALIATGASDGTARVWDADTGDLLAVFAQGEQVLSASFSPDGDRLLTSADDGTIAIRELARYRGGAGDLARLLRCRVPFELAGDRVVVRERERAECTSTSSAP